MNILPKKRWHVRTKDNIARVRRDEAKAAEEEKEKQRRALLAEQETRTAILRTRARERQGLSSIEGSTKKQIPSSTETRYEVVIRNGACVSVPVTEEKNVVQFTASGHVNFFANLEEGKQVEGVANKEHEQEKKKEQEDYEKQIGLLTYLGQGSRESTGESAWYEKPSLLKTLKNQTQEDISYKDERAKDMFDPLRVIRHYIGKPETTKREQSKKITQPDLRFPAAKPEPISSSPEKKHKKKKRKSRKEEKKAKKHKKDKSRRRSSEKSSKKRRKTSEEANSNSDDSTSESSDSSDSDAEKKQRLALLRAKRLQREKAERAKANKLLAAVNGTVAASSKEKSNRSNTDDSDTDEKLVKAKPKQKYHSQYNPDMARQNQPLDSATKYWLQ
ncbi:leukocyte receptor cluster member 1 homolog [Daphnia carinata]|uniref:leukocyte receptor cluster member 1 homolog n=1 Tax=Daphnia carinata TaxID=120202 RepID=UPI00257F3D65|nr:leukocyte receptor cluster member 1 homolog [Daphnia carinata]